MRTPEEVHAMAAESYPDWMLEAAIADLDRRNLRNQADHETRWMAERSKALRVERRRRKAAGTYRKEDPFPRPAATVPVGRQAGSSRRAGIHL